MSATKNLEWKKVQGTALANLLVVSRNGVELGFIEKPEDSDGDVNAWRAYVGIGARALFIGHRWTRISAEALVEVTLNKPL